jgi:hypothetical protein
MNTARHLLNGVGTSTASLGFAGYIASATGSALNELWNGTSWTEVNDLNTARYGIGGCGTTTAALAFGGANPAVSATTESWNGSTWTEVNDLNSARRYMVISRSTNICIGFWWFYLQHLQR